MLRDATTCGLTHSIPQLPGIVQVLWHVGNILKPEIAIALCSNFLFRFIGRREFLDLVYSIKVCTCRDCQTAAIVIDKWKSITLSDWSLTRLCKERKPQDAYPRANSDQSPRSRSMSPLRAMPTKMVSIRSRSELRIAVIMKPYVSNCRSNGPEKPTALCLRRPKHATREMRLVMVLACSSTMVSIMAIYSSIFSSNNTIPLLCTSCNVSNVSSMH